MQTTNNYADLSLLQAFNRLMSRLRPLPKHRESPEACLSHLAETCRLQGNMLELWAQGYHKQYTAKEQKDEAVGLCALFMKFEQERQGYFLQFITDMQAAEDS